MTDAAAVRESVRRAETIVVKVGSSSITDEGGLNRARLVELTDIIGKLHDAGKKVILVTSGAVATGLGPMPIEQRPSDLPTLQAAAAVGQSLLMTAYTEELTDHGVVTAQVLLTVDDMVRRTTYRNAQNTINRLLAMNILPIVNENDAVATDELRFGDNDRLAALVAQMAHAEALVLLSDVPSLLSAPPEDPTAVRIPFVAGPEDLDALTIGGSGSAVGTGGMATKVHAAVIAADSGIPSVLTSFDLAVSAVRGEDVGTYFGPTHSRRQTRLLWLAHLAEPTGSIRVDAGAAKALTEGGKSLLAAGVVDVSGRFEAGEPVDIVDPRGTRLARGLPNFSADELPQVFGLSKSELGRRFGVSFQREVVHRNDMILTKNGTV